MAVETLVFNAEQQAALLGHAFTDPVEVWPKLNVIGTTKEWLVDPRLEELFVKIDEFKDIYKRPPRAQELINYITNLGDAEQVEGYKRTLVWCAKACKENGLDVLLTKLSEWAKGRFIYVQLRKINEIFNQGDIAKACKLYEESSTQLQKLSLEFNGNLDVLRPSPERIENEIQARNLEIKNALSFGVKYLDEALIGILPNDVVLIGAKSGAGKTELAQIIARHNAVKGKKVAMFALEAEEMEIERRILYPRLVQAYKNAGNYISKGLLSYNKFRWCKVDEILAPYYDQVKADYKAEYPTLKTYYRMAASFGVKELEKEILALRGKVDLVVIDHLHYVDLDGDNENRGLKEVVQKIRDLALILGVPFVCVAHLRKNSTRGGIVPDQEDFHGSSDVIKIATKAIMLSRAGAPGKIDVDEYGGYGTFMRIVKARVDGSILHTTPIVFYDIESGFYKDQYALGTINFANTGWEPLPDNKYPAWAESAVIRSIQTI